MPLVKETPYAAIAYQVIRASTWVHSRLGPGQHRSAYRQALGSKLAELGLRVRAQQPFEIWLDDGTEIVLYVPDFLIGDEVALEVAVEPEGPTVEHQQEILRYLAASGRSTTLWLNFDGTCVDYRYLCLGESSALGGQLSVLRA